MSLFLQLTLFGSIVHASNYHSNQPVTLDNEHLVVFQELGLLFNPSNLSDAWTENNSTGNNANLEESVKAYMNSKHRSTTWPLNETQTLFNNPPSIEYMNLEAALFITDPIAQRQKDKRYQDNETYKQLLQNETNQQLLRLKRAALLGGLGLTMFSTPIKPLPSIGTFPRSQVGNLYRLFQLKPFPWIVKNTPVLPQNQYDQILAIPINEDSRPIQFSTKQLHLCKQVNSLFLCDLFEQITTVPTHESCLIALANKQYKDAIHLCNFTISRPNELLYQIQPEQYLLYSADHQPQVYQCAGNNWSGLTITAGISILTVSDECNLNLTEHQINYQASYQSNPVIEILPISSVYNRTRNYYIKTQTIIELVACSILLFLSLIAAIRAICNRVNRPHLIQLPL
jgi:hypothetical protein